jgi:uncharacterized membrane protein YcaP (DUF421 family)
VLDFDFTWSPLARLLFAGELVYGGSVRSATIRRLVKSEPALLLHQGQLLRGAMMAERVTEEEIRAAVRAQGVGTLEDVAVVVLETDGSLTVLRQAGQGSASTLVGVTNWPSTAS